MKKNLILQTITATVVLATSSWAVAAPSQGPGDVTLYNNSGDLWTASLGSSPSQVSFTDVFTFTMTVTPGSTAWGTFINTAYEGIGNITFTSADLNGIPLITSSTPVDSIVFNVASLPASSVTGDLVLTIHGISSGGGSYGGDFNVVMAAVPEPETYAMMLGGLGILAMLSRRRKQ
jgi:hypothetical protein